MARKRKTIQPRTFPEKLEDIVRRVLDLSKTAYRNRMSLSGSNYYANKLVELRADAVNTYRDLARHTPGDSAALGEMIDQVFDPRTPYQTRVQVARELIFSLRTTWRTGSSVLTENEELFPLSILSQTKRSHLVTVGRQMNGCFSQGWYDACAVMLRRLLEIVLIEAFEANGVASKIKRTNGEYQHLSELIEVAIKETTWNLSRNCKKALPQLRDLGHRSAHGRYFFARREDLERVRSDCRIVIEEFLHHAKLL